MSGSGFSISLKGPAKVLGRVPYVHGLRRYGSVLRYSAIVTELIPLFSVVLLNLSEKFVKEPHSVAAFPHGFCFRYRSISLRTFAFFFFDSLDRF